VEYLLLHEFHIRKFIVPDKISQREKENQANKRKNAIRPDEGMEGEEDEPFEAAPSDATGKQRKRGPAYLGGLVLEPKKGLYDRFVLLLDFNSLYPSIIQVNLLTVYTAHSGLSCFSNLGVLASPFLCLLGM
jgi:DNA polymerase alpha subunit A